MSTLQQVATREQVVAEANSWLKTPYVRRACVKGAGCDCATFIFCIFHICGLVPIEEIGVFSHDWYHHTTEEKYMLRIMRHAHKVAEAISYPTLNALPGNIVLTRSVHSKVFNHGGIVKKWPWVYHAVSPCVEVVDASTHRLWDHQTVLVLDPWEKMKLDRR